jgi:hypothetical protein
MVSIPLTGGNIRNCHVSVTRLRDFLPADVFGAAKKKNGLGRPVAIHLEGLNSTVETDVGRDAKTGRPRGMLVNVVELIQGNDGRDVEKAALFK